MDAPDAVGAKLPVGATVQVHSLVARRELNGSIGVVCAAPRSDESSRYGVQIRNEKKPLSIKSTNLTLVSLDISDPQPSAILEGNSLLLSIGHQPHLLSSLLFVMPAPGISAVLASSKTLHTEAGALLPMTLRLRGLPGASLRTLHRAESALLYDNFASPLIAERWSFGPSAPPRSRPSYRAVEVVCDSEGSTPAQAVGADPPVGSSYVDRTLPLAPGCRAFCSIPFVETDTEGPRRQIVVVLAPASGRRASLLGRRPPRGEPPPDEESMHWWVRPLPIRAESNGDAASIGGVWGGAGDGQATLERGQQQAFIARERDLALVYHPHWDASPPPRHHLRLHGGWRMNFTGCMRTFPRPLRPVRLSFRVQLVAACPVRSFFNIFLSSAPEPYADEAVFYCGSRHHPPEPEDVCSFLLDTRAETGMSRPMLWLPSGVNATLLASSATPPDGPPLPPGLSTGEWHSVIFEFDWVAMQMECFVNGRRMVQTPPGVQALSRLPDALSFGPHALLRDTADPSNPLQRTPAEQAHATRLVQQLMGGFTRLYLFTWLDVGASDDDSEDLVPDVRIADLCME